MIIVASKSGQLANRLFLFAHLAAFAAEHNLVVANLSFGEYCDHFMNMQGDLFCRFPPRKSVHVPSARQRQRTYETLRWWTHRFFYHKALLPKGIRIIDVAFSHFCYMNEEDFQQAVRSSFLLVLCGWRFRDTEAFQKNAATLRHFFEPSAAVQKHVASVMRSCRANAKIVVGIHARRGDYKEFRGGRYFFEPSQYAALMHQMCGLFPHQPLSFLVCSNEALPADAFVEFNCHFASGHAAEDLYALAACNYLIGPPSTYSQWASFYGQVPLYQIVDPNIAPSLDSFLVADGRCDLPEDVAAYPKWNGNDSCCLLA